MFVLFVVHILTWHIYGTCVQVMAVSDSICWYLTLCRWHRRFRRFEWS